MNTVKQTRNKPIFNVSSYRSYIASSFRSLDHVVFLNPFWETNCHLPQTLCVTAKHFEWVILNDNYANKGEKYQITFHGVLF